MELELALLGLLTTALFIGWLGIYPGGIIVPSYLILFLDQPPRIFATLLISLITLGCFRILSRHTILFGSRRFVFMLACAGLLTYVWSMVFPGALGVSIEYRVIGWVIPGLIANHFHRQGVGITLSALAAVTVFTYLLGRLALGIIGGG